MLDMLLSKRPWHIKRNASVMAHCLPNFELFTSQFNLTENIHVIVEKDDNVTSCHPTAHGNKWRFLFEVSVFLSIFPDKRSFFFLLFWSYFSSAALVSQIPLVQKHWGKYVTNIQIPSLVFSFFILRFLDAVGFQHNWETKTHINKTLITLMPLVGRSTH